MRAEVTGNWTTLDSRQMFVVPASADDARRIICRPTGPRMLYDQDPCGDQSLEGHRKERTRTGPRTRPRDRQARLRFQVGGGRGKAGLCNDWPLRLRRVSELLHKRVRHSGADIENCRRPLVPGVLAGRRSLALHSAVFGCLGSKPVTKPLPIEPCQSARLSSICTLGGFFCGPLCATWPMQLQCNQGLSFRPSSRPAWTSARAAVLTPS